MALVAVIQLVLDAQLLEHEHTTYAKHILLLDAVFPIAAVELVSDGAVPLAVEVDIGIHEIELHASHVHPPNVGINHAARIGHLKYHLLSALVEHRLYGQLIEILSLIVCNLCAIHRKRLSEIAIAIQEAHGSHWIAAVGSLLDIVACKNAQTT